MNQPDWKSRRETAEKIWRAGVKAVDSMQLVKQAVLLTEQELVIAGQPFLRPKLGKIVVVGAGKAGAGMAAGFEKGLPKSFLEEKVTGWVNVPADCVNPDHKNELQKIHLHAARPAGINEPTPEGVYGTEKILELVSGLEPNDLCVVLISGGGSALLPAPASGISLEDKLNITQQLARVGATIGELNTVRSTISKIKAGGLLKACASKNMVTLIISDVIGDPLETIASGPTILAEPQYEQAMKILKRYLSNRIPENVRKFLTENICDPINASPREKNFSSIAKVKNIILGSNTVAVSAASQYAQQLGFEVVNFGSEQAGVAKDFGIQLIKKTALQVIKNMTSDRPVCILAGGETVVPFTEITKPGKGGRNQEVALAALLQMTKQPTEMMTLLCAGTDGEDGPTDAAGAFADSETLKIAQQLNLKMTDYLNRHDSYHFFQACSSLLKTGPTHTNVMDLCVLLIH